MMRMSWLAVLVLIFGVSTVHAQENGDKLPPLDVITPENAPLLTEIATLGSGTLTGDVAWSPDGSTLAMGSTNGVWLADVATGEKRQLTSGEPAEQVAYNSDGTLLGYVDHQHQVVVVDAATGNIVRVFVQSFTFAFHPARADAIFIYTYQSDIARELIVGIDSGSSYSSPELQLWSVLHDEPLVETNKQHYYGLPFIYRATMFISPDGRWAVVKNSNAEEVNHGCYREDNLDLWHLDASEGLILKAMDWPLDGYYQDYPTFGPDSTLYTMRFSSSIYRENGLQHTAIDADFDVLTHHPSQPILAAARSISIHPWYRQPWGITVNFYNHESQAYLESKRISSLSSLQSLQFSPDGRWLAAAGIGEVEIWQVDPWQQLHRFALHESSQINTDGTQFITRDSENQLQLTRLEDNNLVTQRLPNEWRSRWNVGASQEEMEAQFTPNPDVLLLYVPDAHDYSLWHLKTGEQTPLTPRRAARQEPIFNHDGTQMALLQPNGRLEIWHVGQNAQETQLVNTLHTSFAIGTEVTFSPDFHTVLTMEPQSLMREDQYPPIEPDTEGRLWDVSTGEALFSLGIFQGGFQAVFAQDSRVIGLETAEGLRLIDAQTGVIISQTDQVMYGDYSADLKVFVPAPSYWGDTPGQHPVFSTDTWESTLIEHGSAITSVHPAYGGTGNAIYAGSYRQRFNFLAPDESSVVFYVSDDEGNCATSGQTWVHVLSLQNNATISIYYPWSPYAYSPDSQLWAYSGQNISVWAVHQSVPLAHLETDEFTDVRFTIDQRYVVGQDINGLIHLWGVEESAE